MNSKVTTASLLIFLAMMASTSFAQKINCLAMVGGGQRQGLQVEKLKQGVIPTVVTDYNGHKLAVGLIEESATLILYIDGYTTVAEGFEFEVYSISAPDGAEIMCFVK
jgi:hypothetical protein